MKNKSLLCLTILAAAFTTAVVTPSCNKKFDEPPVYQAPNINANTTIAALKATHVSGQFEAIADDQILEGIVVADDRSGNFYKSIVIQDASGGITLRLDGTSLFTEYPIGRQIFIKAKGLYLGDYNGLIQLGGGVDNSNPAQPSLAPLASNLFDTYIVKGNTGNSVTPRVVDLSYLKAHLDSFQSTLIQLNNYEFGAADTAKVYAPPQQTVNFTINSCSGGPIVVRNSGYANFAGYNLPNGNGSIVAVFSIFGSTPQLFIRDTSDVKFNGARCNGGGGNATAISIDALRQMYQGTGVKLGAYKIKGTVISDAAAKNVSNGTAIIQDGDKGIAVYFGGTVSYLVGDSIELDVTGDSLITFSGALELKTAQGTAKPNPVMTGRTVTPKVMTVADLKTALAAPLSTSIENTLVQVAGAVASPAGTYSGNKTLTDATGGITLYTASAATFSGTTMPTTASTWTGIATVFPSGNELKLRNANDVVAGTGGGPGPVTGTGINLTTSPVIFDFDGIGSGLPTGVSVYTAATSATIGSAGTFNTAKEIWAHTTAGFKNFASATSLTASTDSASQVAATDRALGVRQTGSTDKGVAFVFQIANTSGKSNLKLDFQLQSLDNTSPRATKWTIDYATGDNPTAYTPATATGTVTTGGNTFINNAVSVNFGSVLDNMSGKVWVRIVVLDATTGTGNRTSSAIDNVQFSWN